MCQLVWAALHPEKIEKVTYYLTKRQYSSKQASIQVLANHGPQMLIISVLMVLCESLGHACDPRYLKLTILEFLTVPDQTKMVTLGYFAIRAKQEVLGTPYPIINNQKTFAVLVQGPINYLSMISYGVRWVGPSIIPKNGDRYVLLDKTPYCNKQAPILFLVNQGTQILALCFDGSS